MFGYIGDELVLFNRFAHSAGLFGPLHSERTCLMAALPGMEREKGVIAQLHSKWTRLTVAPPGLERGKGRNSPSPGAIRLKGNEFS